MEAVGQLARPGDAARGVVVGQLPFGPNNAVRDGRLRYQERPDDLRGFPGQSERERHLGVGGQGRVTAEKHWAQLVVGHDVDEGVKVWELGVVVRSHGI